MIWVRISNPRSLGSWCIKGADVSVTRVDSSVPLINLMIWVILIHLDHLTMIQITERSMSCLKWQQRPLINSTSRALPSELYPRYYHDIWTAINAYTAQIEINRYSKHSSAEIFRQFNWHLTCKLTCTHAKCEWELISGVLVSWGNQFKVMRLFQLTSLTGKQAKNPHRR